MRWPSTLIELRTKPVCANVAALVADCSRHAGMFGENGFRHTAVFDLGAFRKQAKSKPQDRKLTGEYLGTPVLVEFKVLAGERAGLGSETSTEIDAFFVSVSSGLWAF